MRIVLYSLPASVCVGCRFTKREFERLGIPYAEVPLQSDPQALSYIKETLGYTAAPVVEVDYGDSVTFSWSGFQPTKIEALRATLGGEPYVGNTATPETA